MSNILIIDDEQYIREFLEIKFSGLGHTTKSSGNLTDALALSKVNPYDVVFLDVRLPDGSGLEAIPELKEGPGSPEIIIMTGFSDPDGAELAIKSGAWDYLAKPITLDQFILALQRAVMYRNQCQVHDAPVLLDREDMIGDSDEIKACLANVARAALTTSNVLITGETGTGKELLARIIHRNSPRADRPFVVVDCASLPENLVESLLFGHEKGAYTGAHVARPGLLEQAHQGTLFLDEVGELPLSTQKSFLRVLQERRFRRLGGINELTSDFRLLAATNQDLEEMVGRGTFRRDLLFRLKTFSFNLPPLRERSGDIKCLAIHYANKLSRRFGITDKGFSQDFFQLLEAYDWPGNVRELASTMELVMSQAYNDPILFGKHLPVEIRAKSIRAKVSWESPETVEDRTEDPDLSLNDDQENLPFFKDYRETHLERIEKRYLKRLIALSGGRQKDAQRIAGLARTRLYTLLKKHQLSLKDD